MKGFLRFAGVIEFVLYVVGVVLFAIYLPLVGAYIFYFCLLLILGSVPAVVLFAIAQILETTESTEIKVDRLNKKIELLVLENNIDKSSKEENKDKPVLNLLEKLTDNDKKLYKTKIQSIFLEFHFENYPASEKKVMEKVRDEALVLIDESKTIEEAETIVHNFEESFKEIK